MVVRFCNSLATKKSQKQVSKMLINIKNFFLCIFSACQGIFSKAKNSKKSFLKKIGLKIFFKKVLFGT
jgi:hypothetical protein